MEKKIIAVLITAFLLMTMVTPVVALWEEAANLYNINFTIQRVLETPVIDGFYDGELAYGDPLPVTAADRTIIVPDGDDAAYARAKGEDWTIWMVYDETYLYVLTRTSSEGHENPLSGEDGMVWQSAAMQLGFGPVGISDDQFIEIGLGANDTNGDLTYVVWFNNAPGRVGDWTADDVSKNSAVRIDGAYIWYEMKIPFGAFLPKAAVAQGDQFTTGSVVLIRMPHIGGGTIGSHLGWGIFGERKGAERFVNITLGSQIQPPPIIVIEEEAESGDAAVISPAPGTSTPVPQTNDNIIIFVFAVVTALSGAVLAKRRILQNK